LGAKADGQTCYTRAGHEGREIETEFRRQQNDDQHAEDCFTETADEMTQGQCPVVYPGAVRLVCGHDLGNPLQGGINQSQRPQTENKNQEETQERENHRGKIQERVQELAHKPG